MAYKRLSDVDHVLQRPDTYGGSVHPVEWENVKINGSPGGYETVEVIPMMYKMFDELIVNATDNISRGKTTKIRVILDANGSIDVINDGKPVPIVKHKKEKMWTPTLVFGHLRTSNNYDDTVERMTGGRNGYGAKLANIFSKRFMVIIKDKKKLFRQMWTDNMKKTTGPEIFDQLDARETHISLKVDLERFGVTRIPEGTMRMMIRRVHDIKRVYPDVWVQLNDENIHAPEEDRIFEQKNKRWKFSLNVSDGQFRQNSFVNGIWTRTGGTHVDYVYRQVLQHMDPVLKKLKLRSYDFKRMLDITLSCHLVNPTFDSQMKESCTLPSSKFAFKVQKNIVQMIKASPLMRKLESLSKKKDDRKLSRNDGAKRSSVDVLKLTDAQKAGTSHSHKCTLILTEGDSANALALAGMSVVGSKHYGSYPLKGKILNGYNASNDKWSKNAVITDVIKCLGLKHGMKYTDVKSLRYGSILIMADQDTDGFHIRGLVFSMFGSHWKSLLLIPGFIKVMKTPLVKAFNGKKLLCEFFNEENARKYIEQHPKLRYKFYKGLGTSTSAEAKEMFKHLDRYTFSMDTMCPDSLKKAFDNDDYAKKWRKSIVRCPPKYDTDGPDGRTYEKFVTGPWVEHARASNERSIPDIHDGLKPVQRKILYTLMKRNNTEIKVAQLSGKVSLDTHYHHGEMNVGNAIVNMAQDFPGSNNLPHLEALGQFGTRHQGGKDHASHRYIFTKLQGWVKLMYPEADLPVLEYNRADGHVVEPHHFVPLLPMILMNGVSGIGTGWATDIPSYDVNLNGPFYKGLNGDIRNMKSYGVWTYENDVLTVTDLPVGLWTSTFKERLKRHDKHVLSYTENHTDTTVHFRINLMNISEEDIVKKLGLIQPIKENWVAFKDNVLQQTSFDDVIRTHREARLELYRKRKAYQLNQLEQDIDEKRRRMKFIAHCLKGEVPITSKPFDECVTMCATLGIDSKYLDIRLRDITPDAVNKLEKDIGSLGEKRETLMGTSEDTMWTQELETLKSFLNPSKKRKRFIG